jgi:surface antigen
MKITHIILAGALSAGLAGCAQPGYGNYGSYGNYGGPSISKQQIGTLGGAIAGGLAGSQIGGGTGQLWATGAGVLLGALVGNNIGRSLDRADQAYLAQASQRSFETGTPVQWNNPDSGNYGTVAPGHSYQARNGGYCREYTQTIYVGGHAQKAYGTACRQPDGSWQIQNG